MTLRCSKLTNLTSFAIIFSRQNPIQKACFLPLNALKLSYCNAEFRKNLPGVTPSNARARGAKVRESLA